MSKQKDKLREALAEYIKAYELEYNEEFTDDALLETITDGKEVWTGYQDIHRWYICEDCVYEVEGVFVSFKQYIITGDNSMSDMGLEYDLDDFKIVEKKVRVEEVTYYE